MKAFSIRFADSAPFRRLNVRHMNESDSMEVAEVLERMTLGPSWPLAGEVTITVRDAPDVARVKLTLSVHVNDRASGLPLEIHFLGTLQVTDPLHIARQFASLLEQFLVHEVRESVHYAGDLLNDPHAGGV